MELTYTRQGDYLIPDLIPPERPKVGKYGMMRRSYLENHREWLYTLMLMEDTLNSHLEEIDRQANEMMEQLTSWMAAEQGVTEALKAQNQLLWVQRMNSIRHAAEEIVEFEKFRQDCRMEVYLCRGADPESKGKIENTVKFIKGNFLNNRLYVDDEILNRSCLDWLERTGNAKVHGTTKKVPTEVFKEEREQLRPLVTVDQNADPCILRTVRKDNTVIYDSNRYSVPLGTYNTNPEVQLEIADGNLRILTVFGNLLCEHRISTGRGHDIYFSLVQNIVTAQ